MNRAQLSKFKALPDLLRHLPSDSDLLQAFVNYAGQRGVNPRWYYINRSSRLIINQLRAIIARDLLGSAAYYQVANELDKMVMRAVDELKQKK